MPPASAAACRAFKPLPGRLDADEPGIGLADEAAQQADGVRAAADAGDGDVRQPALDRAHLLGRLVADDALQVADDGREGMRADGRAEDVVRAGDVGDPVAHRLVDGVLQRGRARRHLAHLGAERAHAQHVGGLAADVLGAHVDDALEAQQRAGRGRRHAVLAGAGLGDDARLAEPQRQQRLAERVVDLVRAGVVEVLALQVQAEVARLASGPPLQLGSQAVGAVDGGRPADVVDEELAELRPEGRLRADRRVARPRGRGARP